MSREKDVASIEIGGQARSHLGKERQAMTHVDLTSIVQKAVRILENRLQTIGSLLCLAKDSVRDARLDGSRARLYIDVGGTVKDEPTKTSSV